MPCHLHPVEFPVFRHIDFSFGKGVFSAELKKGL
jgi:hypothetical protein